MLWLYCDESYDSKSKKSDVFVVGGFVAEEDVWTKIERRWIAKNKRVGVSCFHASHINARDYEFAGWTPQRSKRYVKDLLQILRQQRRKLHAVSIGILVKDYERIISEHGRDMLGSPYIVCFKECIALIAEELHDSTHNWPKDEKFSVILDRNPFQLEAIDVFYKMKDNPKWRAAYRLGVCTSGSTKEFVGLQPADLIAYETFRLIYDRHYTGRKVRKALQALLPANGFSGFYYEKEILDRLKEPLESSNSSKNGFIVIHTPSYKAFGDKEKPE